MSEEECSALVGTRFEYFEDYAIYDDQHRLDSPQYIENTLTADDFSFIYKGNRLETLGIFKNSIQVAAIENASGIGDTFYIKGENTLIIPWDGVFLKCKESALTADSTVHRFLKKDWQMKVPNRAAVTGADYPATLSVIAPYPVSCEAVVPTVVSKIYPASVCGIFPLYLK